MGSTVYESKWLQYLVVYKLKLPFEICWWLLKLELGRQSKKKKSQSEKENMLSNDAMLSKLVLPAIFRKQQHSYISRKLRTVLWLVSMTGGQKNVTFSGNITALYGVKWSSHSDYQYFEYQGGTHRYSRNRISATRTAGRIQPTKLVISILQLFIPR